MSILTGSARVTVAALMEKITALEQQIATQSPATAAAGQGAFRSKAERAAGKGWPCKAGCARRDLRTEKRAASHGADGHFARAKGQG